MAGDEVNVVNAISRNEHDLREIGGVIDAVRRLHESGVQMGVLKACAKTT